MAAGETGGHDQALRIDLAQGWKEAVFADGPRNFVVLALVAEGTGHAAATAVQQVGLAVGNCVEQLQRRLHADQGLLVAVAMQENFLGGGAKSRLLAQCLASPFLKGGTGGGDSGSGFFPGAAQQLGVVVAHCRITAGFAKEDWHTACGQRQKDAAGGFSLLSRLVQEALGDQRAATTHPRRDHDLVAQARGQAGHRPGMFGLVVVGEGIGKKCHRGTGWILWLMVLRPPLQEGRARQRRELAPSVEAEELFAEPAPAPVAGEKIQGRCQAAAPADEFFYPPQAAIP